MSRFAATSLEQKQGMKNDKHLMKFPARVSPIAQPSHMQLLHLKPFLLWGLLPPTNSPSGIYFH